METAPLTLAQTHARNAALETKRDNSVAASEEHDLAAAEFAAAAQQTKDHEVLRLLNLMEQHHKRLGHMLKFRHTTSAQDHAEETNLEHETPQPTSKFSTTNAQPASGETTSQPPRLVRTGRPTARDLSSSIASNLASARGIPSHRLKKPTPASPLVSNSQADGRFAQDEEAFVPSSSRKNSQNQSTRSTSASTNRPSWAPPPNINDTAISNAESAKADSTASDAPFQQFYSTFESLINKLSAPLAFAGLPLNPAPTLVAPTTAPPSKLQPPKQSQPPPDKPLEASINYSQLISKAAIRAVTRSDKSLPYGNPSESFYVVPTTGGTTSYAEIMTRADREASHHRRNISNFSAGTADDFEDAASTILAIPSPVASRPGLSNEKKFNGKTMEELSLENKALKHLSDTLSKRLHVFEMSAQTSSAALAQSIRSLHLSPLNTPENSRGKSNTTTAFNADSGHVTTSSSNAPSAETTRLRCRISDLEEILKKSDARARKREEENVKLRDTLGKYRDKWDSLKAGAKARRERVTGEAAGKGKEKLGSEAGTERDDYDGDSVT